MRDRIFKARDLLIELDQSLIAIRHHIPESARASVDSFRIRGLALIKILDWAGKQMPV